MIIKHLYKNFYLHSSIFLMICMAVAFKIVYLKDITSSQQPLCIILEDIQMTQEERNFLHELLVFDHIDYQNVNNPLFPHSPLSGILKYPSVFQDILERQEKRLVLVCSSLIKEWYIETLNQQTKLHNLKNFFQEILTLEDHQSYILGSFHDGPFLVDPRLFVSYHDRDILFFLKSSLEQSFLTESFQHYPFIATRLPSDNYLLKSYYFSKKHPQNPILEESFLSSVCGNIFFQNMIWHMKIAFIEAPIPSFSTHHANLYREQLSFDKLKMVFKEDAASCDNLLKEILLADLHKKLDDPHLEHLIDIEYVDKISKLKLFWPETVNYLFENA